LFEVNSEQRTGAKKQMKKGPAFSSKDESGWSRGVCGGILDEIDENLDEKFHLYGLVSI